MHEQQEELDRLDVQVVIVTFEAGFLARAYLEETGLNWPLLIDAKRQLYHGYGMLKASFWDVWGPKTWWSYLRELSRGRRPGKAGGDINQRGGDVLVDSSGIIRVHHVGNGPADRPSVSGLLMEVRRVSEIGRENS